jgi:NADH oxidase (H2O2-forming)
LEKRKITIIGGNIAGVTAAINAREADRDAEITILSKEPYLPYCRRSLTSIVANPTSSLNDITVFSLQLNELKIRFLRGVEASDINPNKRIVKARRTETKKSCTFSYDNLILATGSTTFIPSISGVETKRVFSFRTFEDAVGISREAQWGKKAVIIGGGFAALEIAETLARRGLSVTMVIRSHMLRGLIEPSFSTYLEERVKQKAIELIIGASPEEVGGEKKVAYVKLNNGQKIPASIAVFATGVRPNVKLAEKVGIKLGDTGAIKVNRHMQTSASEIYAVGDCAEILDSLTGKWTYYPIGSVAAKGGAVAGRNACGENKKVEAVVRAQMDTVFGEGVVSIGHGSESAREMGMTVNASELSSMQNYFPLDRLPAAVMMIENSKGEIVGAQIISRRFAPLYAFSLCQAIKERETLGNFLHWRRLPYTSITDPVEKKKLMQK